MATEAQIHFIECLAIDLGYDRLNRQWAIERLIGRKVRFVDELSIAEASKVIEDFKAAKEA